MNQYSPTHAILSAALTFAVPTLASAAAPTGESPDSAAALTVALELDVEVADAPLQAEIQAATQAEFDRQKTEHSLLVGAAESADIVVRVRAWEPEPGVVIIDSSVEFDGARHSKQEGEVCMACTSEDIAGKALVLLPAAVAHAREVRAQADPPAPEIAPAEVELAPEPRARRLGPAGYVGIAASGLGLGATIAGAVFLHRGRVMESDPGAPTIDYTDYRPLGVGLIGVGLGVMVVGNVLLGVDLGVLRERRERDGVRAEVTGFGVSARNGAALVVSGRF